MQGIVKKAIILSTIFISFLTLSMIMSKNHFVAIFGDNMRKNGYLTYLALTIIFLVTVFYVRNNNLIKLGFVFLELLF